MRIFFISLVFGLFMSLYCDQVIGYVDSYKGSVKLKKKNSIRKYKVKEQMKLHSGDMVVTSKKSVAILKLIDGSTITLDEKSTLIFNTQNSIDHKSGKILYQIAKHSQKNALKIKTSFAIIGIKGTTFIINNNDKEKKHYISLKEGLIGIKSLKEEFNLYKRKINKEFEAFKAQEKKEFASFKKGDGYEYIGKVKEFDLKKRKKASFDSHRVQEDQWDNKDSAEFDYFSQILRNVRKD